jgi:diamine N-acetyltransferase
MDDVLLKPIKVDEVSLLSALAKKTFFETFTGTCTPEDMLHFLETHYNQKTLQTELENPSVHYYFTYLNNEVVGYLSYAESNTIFADVATKAIELNRFYILQGYHAKGIAQKMMEHFLGYATNNLYPIAFLGVWEYNYKAQNFYKKFGFELTLKKHAFPAGNTPQTDVYMLKYL